MATEQYSTLLALQRQYIATGKPATLSHRREALQKLKTILKKHSNDLTEAVEKDLRRQPGVSEMLELSGVMMEIDYFLDNLDDWAAPHYVDKTLATALDTPMVVSDPKGVVLLISPWNYPLNMVLLPLVPIIAAGNTVVIKPSELSHHSAAAFDKLFSEYFEPQYISVVQGGIPETTELLKERFDHIMYTGCTPVAKIILAAAAKHITPCTLELGGKCPVVVCDDADIAITAKRLAWGKWLNCGQTCLAPDYVLVTPKSKPKLITELTKTLNEFYGKEVQKSKDFSRIINTRHFDRLNALLEKSQGVKLYQGGEPDRDDVFIPPTIIDSLSDDIVMQDEIFGPILPVVTVENMDEAIEFIRKTEKPLAAYIFTKSNKNIDRLLNETSSGGVTVNDVILHITVDTLPFGGVGHSGFGKYRGKWGFIEFSHPKAVLKRGFFGEQLATARYPPLTPEKQKAMAQLMGTRRAVPKFLKIYLAPLWYIFIGIFLGLLYNKFFKYFH